MTLVSVSRVRSTVPTDLDDASLLELIQEAEAEVIARCGPHGDGTTAITETYVGRGGRDLFLRRKPVSVTSITATTLGGGTPIAIETSSYQLWSAESRIAYLGSSWGTDLLTVVYVPADDRPLRRRVITELVRLTLNQTALQSESVGGEYSYSAPASFEAKRAALFRQLTPMEL